MRVQSRPRWRRRSSMASRSRCRGRKSRIVFQPVAAGIRYEAKSRRPTPVVADEGYAAKVELAQQRCQVGDVPVETVRLFPSRLFREAKSDHVGDNNTVPGACQGLNEITVEEAPCRVAVQQSDRISGSLVDIVHPPAIDLRKTWLPRPLPADAGGQWAIVHAPLLTFTRSWCRATRRCWRRHRRRRCDRVLP